MLATHEPITLPSAIAVGTVVGSNLLNVFLVLGTVAYLHPVRVGERMHAVDAIGLAVVTLLGIIVLRGRRTVTRAEGAMLVAAYFGFLAAAAYFWARHPRPDVRRARRCDMATTLAAGEPVSHCVKSSTI